MGFPMVFPLKPPFSYGNPQLLIPIESQPPCYPETSGVFQTKQRQQLPRRHGSGQVDVVVHLHDLARAKNRGIVGEQKDTHVFMEHPHLYIGYIWIIWVLYRLYMAYNILIYYIGYIYIHMNLLRIRFVGCTSREISLDLAWHTG